MPVFDIHSYLGGSLIPGLAANTAHVTQAMEERAIDGAMLISARAREVDPLAGNRILKAMVEQSPALVGCLVTHTNRAEASITVMRELMTFRKFVAMLLVGPTAGEPVQKVLADDILNAYRRFGKPLFLYAPNAAAVSFALEIARGYPMLRVVLLGMGGRDWRSAVAAAHAATNVLLETSGAMDRAKLPAAAQAVGAHRIVFGSGTPTTDAGAAMGLVEDSRLSAETRELILGVNARRLLGLEEDAG